MRQSLMTAFLRALPGLTALGLVAVALFLPSGRLTPFLDSAMSEQFFFTASHLGAALLYMITPVTFALIGRGTNCHPYPVKAGTVLLSISVLPLLAVNIISMSTTTPDDVGADIGGALLELLGVTACLITSLVFTFALPRAGAVEADRMDHR